MTFAPCMVLIFLLVRFSEGSCPPGCLCTSDILNCVSQVLERFPSPLPFTTATLDLSHNRLTWLGAGTFSGLPRLETLRLSHNYISMLGPGLFHNISSLRHLDLSSNKLEVVVRHHFQELTGLEELLLFNNRIVRVESNALMGLGKLRKVYLSLNQITDFPFFSIRKHSHPNLVTLDLSSNRMYRLPVDELVLLPGAVQRGLYLHNNSMVCDCDTYRMFWHWEHKGYDSVKDYREDYTCLIYGEPRASVRFLRYSRFFENCTVGKMVSLVSPKADLQVYEGELVRLDCASTIRGEDLSYDWVSPHQEDITQLIQNGTLRVKQDGSLEIVAAQPEDSGVYQCTALDKTKMINESREVNLTVVSQGSLEEPFNTGYTTLLGCAITLVLILMYLYLTPCRCRCCKPPPPSLGHPSVADNHCTLAAIFSAPTATDQIMRKANPEKHVVFLEPLTEEQNGHLRAAFAGQHPTILWDMDNLTPMTECDEAV